MKKIITTLLLSAASVACAWASLPQAIDSLASRVTLGTSEGRIIFSDIHSPQGTDAFCIEALPDGRVAIKGTDPVSQAVGLNWYLKYVAGIHISWDNLRQALPDTLPLPAEPICRDTDQQLRYYLNYCTHSYTMAFWDWQRWEQEIDWMALHGVNLPLALTGTETVWRNVLRRLGYSDEAIGRYNAGPAYQAWFLMNNLEGWGGPLTPEWYADREQLQQQIVARMHSLGMQPVLPGYSGMVPHDAGTQLGLDVADPGLWCGFPRPAFLQPADAAFDSIADIYYDELTRLYGTSRYYSIDPFHEGGNTRGVNLAQAGDKIMKAMKRVRPDAVWVVQAWQANPRPAMIDTLRRGDLLVLDLNSEKRPQWGDSVSVWFRPDGFIGHDWLYCMLLNFGGNVGMHGRMQAVMDGYDRARHSRFDSTLRGVGATPEAIDNNPVMYELLFELPWLGDTLPTVDRWLEGYLTARYGAAPTDGVREAWQLLKNSVYGAPHDIEGEGTIESLFCARPSRNPRSVSTWGSSQLFYDPDITARAAALIEADSALYASSPGFRYDMLDIRRQANADHGNQLLRRIAQDSVPDPALAREFLTLILTQDSLLSHHPDMSVDTWLDRASRLAPDTAQRRWLRRNAAMLITVWGDSIPSNVRGLHDYSHREWAGILRDLYYERWRAWFDALAQGRPTPGTDDFYRMELDWVDRVSRQ